MYRNPEFCGEMDGHKSKWKQQETGMRQSCPLSPYPFIILMSVIFHDIHQADTQAFQQQRVTGTEFDEVLYADDTVCIAQTERAMNRLLAATEMEGNKIRHAIQQTKLRIYGYRRGGARKI